MQPTNQNPRTPQSPGDVFAVTSPEHDQYASFAGRSYFGSFDFFFFITIDLKKKDI